jgi:hypothetical protein
LQRDPLGYHDGFNLYQYVSSSPMNWVDTFGEQQIDPGDVPPDVDGRDEPTDCTFECAGSPKAVGGPPPGIFEPGLDPDTLLKACTCLPKSSCSKITVGGHGAADAGVCVTTPGDDGPVYHDCFGCRRGRLTKHFGRIAACFKQRLQPGGYVRICSCGGWNPQTFDECLKRMARIIGAKVCACSGAATSNDERYCVCKGKWVCRG